MPNPLQAVTIQALNALLPPLCLSCEEMVMEQQGLCAPCWKGLNFIAAPFCACCGQPFPFEGVEGPEALCGACLMERPDFRFARAAFTYDEKSRALILAFKHRDRTDAAPIFARFLHTAAPALVTDCDIILPVPLHRFRLFSRRYNQAALLALALGKFSGKPVNLDTLVRRRATPSQGHLPRAARQRNVAGAFAVVSRHAGTVQGGRILLIDDVMTTGATANACARALLKAGAASVDVLVLARVVKVE